MDKLHDLPVQQRLAHFATHFLSQDDHSKQLPGLSDLLHMDSKSSLHKEDFLRRLLKIFRDADESDESSDKTFERLHARSTDAQKEWLNRFIDGESLDVVGRDFKPQASEGVRNELERLEHMMPTTLWHLEKAEHVTEMGTDDHQSSLQKLYDKFFPGHDQATEKDKRNVKVYQPPIDFENWGGTVSNHPKLFCVPTTVGGVIAIVQYAGIKGLPVRVSGYRHSWAPVFGEAKGGIMISMLSLRDTGEEVNTLSLPLALPPPTELTSIELVDEERGWVKVGAGTTNEQMRRWCLKNGKLTLSINVIMVETTFGGSNAMMCHGAGRQHKTISDLVVAIDYVDCHGVLRSITQNDEDFLSAAAGCFGLMGVITHLTLKVEPMSYAMMHPLKLAVIDAIPPPAHYRELIPRALSLERSPEEIAAAVKEFERRATDCYYAEWYWFPYDDHVWANTWDTTDVAEGAQEYPSTVEVFEQWLQGVTIEAIQNVLKETVEEDWAALLRTTLISKLAIHTFDAGQDIKTPLPDGLHYRRAIQETRVRDCELLIELPPHPNNPTLPNLDIVRQAWWDAILLAYANTKTCPQRMPLEMRIVGDSDLIMASQHGNKLGTCAINILTLQDAKDEWLAYAQQAVDLWMKYAKTDGSRDGIVTDQVSAMNGYRDEPEAREQDGRMSDSISTDRPGEKVRVRPHWAKEWVDFNIQGMGAREYVRNVAYKEEIPQFREVLKRIGRKHGWTMQDIRQRFSNSLFDYLIFDEGNVPDIYEGLVPNLNGVGLAPRDHILARNE